MTDTSKFSSIDIVRSLPIGRKLVMLEATSGEDSEGVERTYAPGAVGTIVRFDTFDGQGLSVTVAIGDNEDHQIVNVFDEVDYDGLFPFIPQVSRIIFDPASKAPFTLVFDLLDNDSDFTILHGENTLPGAVRAAHKIGHRPLHYHQAGRGESAIPRAVIPKD